VQDVVENTGMPGPIGAPPAGGRTPRVREALLLVLASLLLTVSLGLYLQLRDLLTGIVWTEILCLLVPVAAAMRIGRYAFRSTLAMRWPGWGALGMAVLAGPAAALLAGQVFWLQSLLWSPPAWYLEMMETLAAEARSGNLLLGILAVSVLPALGEETLFRGFVMTGFRARWGPVASVGASAFLFALVHVDPFRFVAVGLLGVFLGYLVRASGSLLPALVVHAVNNALALLPPSLAEVRGLGWISGNRSAPALWVAGSAAVLLLVIVWFQRSGGTQSIRTTGGRT